MSSKTAYVKIHGEKIYVNWTGSVWRTSNGGEYASAADALDAELYTYYAEGGDVDDWYDGIADCIGVEYEN